MLKNHYTKSKKTFAHDSLHAEVLAACREKKWEVGEPQINISKCRKDIAICYPIACLDLPPLSDGVSHMFSVVSSTTGHLRLTMYGGIFVSGMCILTDRMRYRRKHTRRMTLSWVIGKMLFEYTDMGWAIPGMIEGWKGTRLTQQQIDLILMEAARREILTWSRIGTMCKLLQHKTSWDLLIAFAESSKMKTPLRYEQIEQCRSFAQMLPTLYRPPSKTIW